MPNKLRTVVIGVGSMGKNHARVYSEISNLVAVSDLNQKIGQEIAQKHNIPYYQDFKKMIEVEKPDAVSVVVPTKHHCSVVLETLGCKIPTLVEKPIADSVLNAKLMIKTAQKNKTLLQVGHIERFNPVIKKLKEIIAKKDLGEIISILVRRVGGYSAGVRDSDIAVDLAIHDLDIVNFLLDEFPKKVVVNKQQTVSRKLQDSVDFFLKFKKVSAFVQANWVTPVKIRKLNITGTKGYLELDYLNQKITFYKSIYEKYCDPTDNFLDYILKFSEEEKIDIMVEKKEPLKEELKHFLTCVKNGSREKPIYAVQALKIALT